ncbi:MAG: extracellular solute-binding protein [Oscillospiraceae bacterium]|nr:extracellular solute-binding protein [Oscillospiraceae bacterium]MBQ7054746.1 extracellular solute-binding protein [Oscillospiraceae bacterium]
MKKLIALTLATVMLLALCACGDTGTASGDVSYDIPEGKQLPNDAVVNVTVASHASWPYDEDWKIWEYIREAMGGTINYNAVPSSDFGTKFPLIMASPEEFPDVIGFQNKPIGFSDYAQQGAFLALDNYEEFLPDYNEFWSSLPEKDQWMRNTRKASDGKIYYAPTYGRERATNVRSWLYRKDIFEKHNLETPETIDDLYMVSKKLKEIYPESYPFCLRTGLGNMNVIGSSWKPNFRYNTYYDFENEKWSYGATESKVMLEMVEFFKKMVDEKLVPADFFTINVSSWQELVTTDRGFIMPEYQVRIDFFNTIARAKNPEYTIAAMIPPKSTNGTGIAMVNKLNHDPTGFAALNTNNAGRIANAMRYINWFYSDEGAEIISWGKEGETYEVVDGKRKFLVGEDESVNTKYGLKTIGTYLRVDPAMIDASVSEEQAATTDFILEHTYPELDPKLYMELSAEDSTLVADYETSLKTVVEENLQKFIIGQRPLSEWDKFQEELKELPVDELLAVYEKAYNKVK